MSMIHVKVCACGFENGTCVVQHRALLEMWRHEVGSRRTDFEIRRGLRAWMCHECINEKGPMCHATPRFLVLTRSSLHKR